MAVKAKITPDEFGKLPKDVQGHYTEKDGVHFLDVVATDGLELADTAGLKTALQKERKAAREASEKLKTFEGLDDPEAAREALKKMAEIAGWDPEKKLAEAKKLYEKQIADKYEGDRKQLENKHAAEMTVREKKLAATRSTLESTMIDERALRAIGEKKGSTKLLLPVVRGRLRLAEDEKSSKFGVEVIDGEGLARLSTKAGSTSPMTIEELVEELKGDPEYARAFDGSGSTGSGASQGDASRQTGSTITLSNADARDPAKYKAAREQAEKAGKQLQIQ